MATMKDVEKVLESTDDVLQKDADSNFETPDDVNREDYESSDVHRVDEPQEEWTLDEFDKLGPSVFPPEIREQLDLPKIEALYQNGKSVSILLTGKTGSGKSTLVNGILGMKVDDKGAAKEGESIKGLCTTEVREYKTMKGKVNVTVWDTPGLQDGTENQDSYLREMKEKCTTRDLTMYCINVSSTRFVRGTDNPDVVEEAYEIIWS